MTGLDELREHGRMTWSEGEQGWVAAPDEVMRALASDGFEEYKRESTTSPHDHQPGGMWRGIHTRTGAVASAIWVNQLLWPKTVVFITVGGDSLRGDVSSPELYRQHEDGGEA